MVLNRLRLTALGALVYVVAVTWVSLSGLAPPAIVGADAAADVFSAVRAGATVEEIARAPHPPNSAEHDRVRAWIVDELRALGLEPEVHDATVQHQPDDDWMRVGRVRNVIARWPGTRGSGPAICLSAHYDSVASGPGAADDGAGVATILEALRALRAGPPLANDVLVLITDAEEAGLLGARAFVARRIEKEDIGLVLNFEARGHRGPSVMFETSEGNGALIRAYAEAVPRPVADSTAYELYRRMPNDTDLSVFKEAGLKGMNFAFFGGVHHYHTAEDTPAALDLRSVQQQGDAAVALVRRFGSVALDVDEMRDGDDLVYATLPGGVVHHDPVWMSWVVLLAGLGLLGFGVRHGSRVGRLTWRGLRLGILVPVIAVPACTLAALAIQLIFGASPMGGLPSRQALLDASAVYPGVLLLTISVHSLVLLKMRPGSKIDGLWGGALIAFAGPSVVVTATAPGASMLFVWPLLFGAAGFCLVMLRRDRRRVGVREFVAAGVAVLPVFLLAGPLIAMLTELVSISGAFLVAAATSFFLSLAVPQLLFLTTIRKWALTIGSGVIGFGIIGAAIVTGGSSPDRPDWNSLFYYTDGDAGAWFSFDRVQDDWTGIYLGEDPTRAPRPDIVPGVEYPVLAAPTEALPVPGAEIELEAVKIDGGIRTIDLRCTVPDGTRKVWLACGERARFLMVGGESFEAEGQGEVEFRAAPSTFEIKMLSNDREPVHVMIWTLTPGLPDVGVPRFDGMICRPNLADASIVRKRFEF